MHITVLAEKRGQALERILKISKTLSQSLQLDAALIERLQPTVKDPDVRDLRRLEAVADLLDAIAQNRSGAVAEPLLALDPIPMETGTGLPEPIPDAEGEAAE